MHCRAQLLLRTVNSKILAQSLTRRCLYGNTQSNVLRTATSSSHNLSTYRQQQRCASSSCGSAQFRSLLGGAIHHRSSSSNSNNSTYAIVQIRMQHSAPQRSDKEGEQQQQVEKQGLWQRFRTLRANAKLLLKRYGWVAIGVYYTSYLAMFGVAYAALDLGLVGPYDTTVLLKYAYDGMTWAAASAGHDTMPLALQEYYFR
jgi:hypothetical protein